MGVEELVERQEPAHDVLRGIDAVAPQDELAIADEVVERRQLGLRRVRGEGLAQVLGVGGERADEDGRGWPVAAEGDVGRRLERGRPPRRVEPARHLGHGAADRTGDVVGEDPDGVRTAERGVGEVHDAKVGSL